MKLDRKLVKITKELWKCGQRPFCFIDVCQKKYRFKWGLHL